MPAEFPNSKLKLLQKHLHALHTFADTFSGATAMPLFKLPALAAQSIRPDC